MKFGKHLRGIVEWSNPEWQPNFLSYKDLKKRISARPTTSIPDSDTSGPDDDASPPESSAVRAALDANAPFFEQLRVEVDKVNDFFLEKQEDFVIEHQHLSARVQQALVPGAASRAEVSRLRQRLIDFHAQLVILENYSTVNYTGFRKILKKHDKKTGLRLRSSCLRDVTATPFFLCDTARRLLLSTEQQVADLDRISKFRRVDTEDGLPSHPVYAVTPLPRLHPADGDSIHAQHTDTNLTQLSHMIDVLDETSPSQHPSLPPDAISPSLPIRPHVDTPEISEPDPSNRNSTPASEHPPSRR